MYKTDTDTNTQGTLTQRRTHTLVEKGTFTEVEQLNSSKEAYKRGNGARTGLSKLERAIASTTTIIPI